MKKNIYILAAALFVLIPSVASAAIAFDNVLEGSFGSGTSQTVSFTTSGSDRFLVVYIESGYPASDDVTGVTYGGVAMTRQMSTTRARESYIYTLSNPPVGANNIVASFNRSTDSNLIVATSYTGVKQSGQPEDINFSTGSQTASITTISNNAWVVGASEADSGYSAYSGTTFRSGNASYRMIDNNGPKTPAGSVTLGMSGASGSLAVFLMSLAPAPEPIGTTNRIAKFINSMEIGDSLLSDNGSNVTLTSGNLFLPIASSIDVSAAGALNFGTATATAITIGRTAATTTIAGPLSAGIVTLSSLRTGSNCASSASPALCGSSSAGSVAIAAGDNTLVVNTNAVSAASQIFITEDSSLGTRLGITCNTTSGRAYSVSARSAGTSFTVKSSGDIATNKACLSYFIVN